MTEIFGALRRCVSAGVLRGQSGPGSRVFVRPNVAHGARALHGAVRRASPGDARKARGTRHLALLVGLIVALLAGQQISPGGAGPQPNLLSRSDLANPNPQVPHEAACGADGLRVCLPASLIVSPPSLRVGAEAPVAASAVESGVAVPIAQPRVFQRWFVELARDPEPPPPPPPPPKPPRPASPAGLNLWSDGDSVSYFMTTNLFSMLSDYGASPVRAADYKISSRLTGPSGNSAVLGVAFSDWFTYIAEEMAQYDPDVVVFMVGANDAGFVDPESFRADAARMMDLLRREGRIVAWVGLPAFVREDLAGRAPALNVAARAAAASRSWVVFVDTSDIAPDGADGVHFGPGHARLLASAVIEALFPGLAGR